ncbi:MgtC/SapB family protein [Thalassorhabdomicrobium marinisediminis]|uniref:Protein MgtC n=1 Tax=Thalassorhabdomicrobium marinisediminis TaxID=2170577 RepID=A0A2T7FT15_9RHOB|nr:MgtC/SapB family protein [Thalassorhabdomicrobium marinisediminis]PVA05295.1 hypothetical protein DC363_15880 [Thalassorhabdomicrobium marinisediminis]
MNDMFSSDTLTFMTVAYRLVAATLLPLAIGLERYFRNKPIDFRPFVIISLVACALMIGTADYLATMQSDGNRMDPTRIMEGVITGIGFLGAGAMYRDGDFIKGAGSAASIWSAGAIGLLCGIGELWLAGIATGGILVLMIAAEPFAGHWSNQHDDDEGLS